MLYSKAMLYVHINNVHVPEAEAVIPVKDRGFRFGDGVFETMSVHHGVIYQYEKHRERLHQSLKALSMTYDTSRLYEQCMALIAKNGLREGAVRLFITRGEQSAGYLPADESVPNLIIETQLHPARPSSPVSLWVSSYAKPSAKALPVHCKTMQGLNSVLARMEAKAHDCFEALLLREDGLICECSSGNIFWVKDGELYTPALECGILPGTIRDAVIRLSPYPVHQGQFTLDEMAQADEVFLTNVTWGILPIAGLSPQNLSWKKGDISATLRSLLTEDITAYAAAGNITVD